MNGTNFDQILYLSGKKGDQWVWTDKNGGSLGVRVALKWEKEISHMSRIFKVDILFYRSYLSMKMLHFI